MKSSKITFILILCFAALFKTNVSWAELSVSVTNKEGNPYTKWAIDNAALDTVYIMNANEFLKITNDGTATADYKLKVSSPGLWSYSTTTNENQCVLMGIFAADDPASYTPQESDFSTMFDIIDPQGSIAGKSEAYTGHFQGAAPDYDGYSVAPGQGRKLYFYLKTPGNIQPVLQEQNIGITIEAIAH